MVNGHLPSNISIEHGLSSRTCDSFVRVYSRNNQALFWLLTTDYHNFVLCSKLLSILYIFLKIKLGNSRTVQ